MKTLLLNQNYSPISFLSWKRVVKLVVRDKVEVLSNWGHKIKFGKGEFDHPSIVKLRYYVPRHIKSRRYNRAGVFKRDKNTCQYCSKTEKISNLTIDHVIPRSQGGKTTWENCVSCCFTCNNDKANCTPKQAGMKLIKKPAIPRLTAWHEYVLIPLKHDDWEHYIMNQ